MSGHNGQTQKPMDYDDAAPAPPVPAGGYPQASPSPQPFTGPAAAGTSGPVSSTLLQTRGFTSEAYPSSGAPAPVPFGVPEQYPLDIHTTPAINSYASKSVPSATTQDRGPFTSNATSFDGLQQTMSSIRGNTFQQNQPGISGTPVTGAFSSMYGPQRSMHTSIAPLLQSSAEQEAEFTDPLLDNRQRVASSGLMSPRTLLPRKRKVAEDSSYTSPMPPYEPPKPRRALTSMHPAFSDPTSCAGFGVPLNQPLNPLASTFTPTAFVPQRNCFHPDRAVLKYLHGMSSISTEANHQLLFEHAFILRYYATVGRMVWKYLAIDTRNAYLGNFYEYFVQKQGNPAWKEVNTSVIQPMLYHACTFVTYELHKYLVEHYVFSADQSQNHVLYWIRALLSCKIGFSAKVEMLAKAMVIWPEENFTFNTAGSAALKQFIAENEQYLDGS